jgi:hypothetical protein
MGKRRKFSTEAREIPATVRIRKTSLSPSDVQTVDSLPTTNAFRTLKDLIEEKSMTDAELALLIEQAQTKGLISTAQVRELNDKQMLLFQVHTQEKQKVLTALSN